MLVCRRVFCRSCEQTLLLLHLADLTQQVWCFLNTSIISEEKCQVTLLSLFTDVHSYFRLLKDCTIAKSSFNLEM